MYLGPANRNPAASGRVLLLYQIFLDGFTAVVIRLFPLELAALLGHV